MKRLDPYLSYIAISSHLPNKGFVKAYDCRFLYVLSGEGELITEDSTFTLSNNTLVYYPCGLSYYLRSDPENPISFVTVNFDFTRSYPKRVAPYGPVKPFDYVKNNERPTQNELDVEWFCSVFTVENAILLRDDFVSLSSLFNSEDTYKEEACAAFLKYIILKIASRFKAENQENKVIRHVVDFIEQNRTLELDNNTIANHFGYHPYYLSVLFKKFKGITLHQYVFNVRMKAAVDMLLHTDLTISEIAEKTGFKNPNHFSVKFKQKYGLPPSVWRVANSIV
jgi:AraC-like DNA-binding protein